MVSCQKGPTRHANNGQSCCDSHIGVNPGNSPTLSTHCLVDDNSCMSKNSTPTMSNDDKAMNVTSSILNDYINFLEAQRERYVRNIRFGHLDINSIRNKFEPVHAILSKGLLDIFCVTESKLDETFPKNQFSIKKTLHYTGKTGMHVEVESCLLAGQIFHTAGDGT